MAEWKSYSLNETGLDKLIYGDEQWVAAPGKMLDVYRETAVWFMGRPPCRNPGCEKKVQPGEETILVVSEDNFSAYCNEACMYEAINTWAKEGPDPVEETAPLTPPRGRRFVFRQ